MQRKREIVSCGVFLAECKKVRRLRRLLAAGPGKAKTIAVVTEVREDGGAKSTTRAAREAEPGPAPQHTVRAGIRANWIDLCFFLVRTIPVLAPFPYIARHIEEAKIIGIK